jgi:hypothetical protein
MSDTEPGGGKHQPHKDQLRKQRGSIGRPKSERIKDHWISFRVTAEDHFQILDKAQRSGLSPGDYARSRVLRGIARRKKAAAVPQPFGDMTRTVYHELRRQGVNLNQIAHHCNRHQVEPPPEVAALAAQILELWRKVLPP